MPIMKELYRLREGNELSESQRLWFRKTKPREELFDVLNDPHEINDLSKDEFYDYIKKGLKEKLERWEEDGTYKALMTELELIEFLWPNQTRPVAVKPSVIIKDKVLTLETTQEGMTLAYRLNSASINDPWTIYTGPVSIEDGSTVDAVADRIGYKSSLLTKVK